MLLYSFAEERQGYKIIEYEIYRYQVRHGIYADGQTSLHDIAFTIWSIIRNTLELIQCLLPRRRAVLHATSR